MITMYDSVSVGQIPADAGAVAGYVGGSWPTYQALSRRFPSSHRLAIAVHQAENADCLDVEQWDATPADVPAWVRRQHARGQTRPVIYADESSMAAVVHELAQAGLAREQVRLWVAHYTGVPHIPAGYDACQYTDQALGRNLDASLCADDFFTVPAKPRPRPRRRPVLHAPHRKVAAGTVTGALGVVLTSVLASAGLHITSELGGAISVLTFALGAYITPTP